MIAVTGGAGFIGSVLVWALNEAGEKNLLLVDQKMKGSPKAKNLAKRVYSEYAESDEFLTGLESGRWDGKLKAIFHMGACSDTTEMDVDFLRKNNTEYSRRVAEWCLRTGAYLAYASSAATYGDGELGFSDDDRKTPSLKPLNPYGQSKLDFDNWVLKNGHEKRLIGYRFFNVYGPNEYHKGGMRSLAQKGYEQIRDTGKLKLFKSYKKEYHDGGQKRDFVYVKDVIDAMLWFHKNSAHKGIFNIGSGRAQSWNDLAHGLFHAMGVKPRIEYVEMPENLKNQYQYFTEADLTKLRSAGCPTVFLSVEHGVHDYVKNYLSKKDAYL